MGRRVCGTQQDGKKAQSLKGCGVENGWRQAGWNAAEFFGSVGGEIIGSIKVAVTSKLGCR